MPLVPFADASGSGGSKSRPMTAMNSPRSAPTTPREPSRRAASAIPSPRSSHGTPRSSQSARGTRVPLQSTFDVAKAVSALAGSGLVRTSFLSELGPLRRPLGKEKLAMGSHTLDLTRTRFVPGGALGRRRPTSSRHHRHRARPPRRRRARRAWPLPTGRSETVWRAAARRLLARSGRAARLLQNAVSSRGIRCAYARRRMRVEQEAAMVVVVAVVWRRRRRRSSS